MSEGNKEESGGRKVLAEGKEFQSTSNVWDKEKCGNVYEVEVDQYLVDKGYCSYLSEYMESLLAVKASGATRAEGGWVSTKTGISYENCMELAKAEGLGPWVNKVG